jgi:hypothetical protein
VTWFYHVAYQHPITTATGHVLGYTYGDVTYDLDSRLDSDDKMWDLRNELGRHADRVHEDSRDGVQRSGGVVVTSITLLASPEEADRLQARVTELETWLRDGCPAHGYHPHNDAICLDCPICRPGGEHRG